MKNDKKTLLCVTADELIRNAISDYLSSSLYDVFFTKNSFEGLKVINEERIDLVIIDVVVPDEIGDEIINENNPWLDEIPVIVLAEIKNIKTVVDCLHRGAWDFIIKPIEDFGIIDVTIEKALDKALLAWENKRYRENLELIIYQRAEQLKFQAQLLESVRESVMAKDIRGNIIYWGKGAEDLFGYKEKEVLGRSIHFSGNTDDKIKEAEKRMEYVLENGYWQGEYLQYKKDGSTFVSDVRIALIKDDDGKPQGFIGLDHDITDRITAEKALKDSEKKYHSLFANMREASALYEVIYNGNSIIDSKVLDVNKAYEEFFHLNREEVVGRLVSEISADRRPSKYLDKIQEASDKNHPVTFETFVPPDRYFDVSAFFFDKNKVATVIDDITEMKRSREQLEQLNRELEERVSERTSLLEDAMEELRFENEERKRAQDELTRLNEELEISRESILEEANKLSMLNEKLIQSEMKLKQANAAKDKFFSIIAHDLKNPLHSVMLTTSFLSDNYSKMDSNHVEMQIRNVFKASTHLSDLLENLMNWSKSQRGRIEYAPEILDLYFIVTDNINLLSDNASRKRIELINKVLQNTNAYVDINMISTVVRNLITNAIKYTPEGGRIIIAARSENNYWVISVNDNGVGIDEKHLDKLFNIDYNFSTRGTNDETGTGLGLVLCKEFVIHNRGKIWAESQKGTGSTFFFTVPKNLLA